MKKIVVLILSLLFLSGCGLLDFQKNQAQEKAVPDKEKKIVIYSSKSDELTNKVIGQFKKAYPDYQGEVYQLGGGDVLNELSANRKKPQVDLWWGGTPAELMAGKKQNLFRPAPSDVADQIYDPYKDRDRYWLGEALYPQAFVTAKSSLGEDLPWQWESLVLGRHQDQLLFISPESDVNYRVWLGAVMYRKGYFQTDDGEKWLLEVDGNTKEYFVDEKALMDRLVATPGLVTWMNLTDALAWRESKKYPVKIYLPIGSQPIPFTGVALIKEAPHPQGAELFMNFLYSDAIQGALIKEDYQISARWNIPTSIRPDWYSEWEWSPQDLDWEWIAGTERKNIQLWQNRIQGKGVPRPQEEKRPLENP